MEKTYVAIGSEISDISDSEIKEHIKSSLSQVLADINVSGKVIIIPPDITRIHSRAGFLTEAAAIHLGDRLGAVLPALGTHTPMNDAEIKKMFGSVPKEKFLVHNWRRSITELGRLESSFIEKATEGAVSYEWPVQVNKVLSKDSPESGGFSLAVSIGQVVPHEVAGMANHAKNIFIGTGGKEAIDKSHFAGAAYGMERIMGKLNNPVRALFDEGFRRYGHLLPPVLWVLTVIGVRQDNSYAVRGLFIGFGRECLEKAADLSQKVNINLLKNKVNKVIVNLNSREYRSAWICNKAIYRTRMAVADGGELIILAPNLCCFGEDSKIDSIIKKYGYRPQDEILKLVKTEPELMSNLSAASHLIHGSPEGRFTVRYCPGNKVTLKEIESIGFQWGALDEAERQYDINKLKMGWNYIKKEEIFFVQNPGLWLYK